MGKYLYLQWKRLMRFLPGTLCVVLLLLGGLLAAFSFVTQHLSSSEKTSKIHIAVCGSLENSFLQMGIQALQAFDETRFSMELLQTTEQEADRALRNGEISAYVVIPDNFVEEAMYGRILPLKLVTTYGASSIVSLFKEEVTTVVSDLLIEAQKGVFGLIDSMDDRGIPYRQQPVDALSFEYVRYVLSRHALTSVTQTGAGNGLGLIEHLLCGFAVLFLLLACLPFAPLTVRRDPALGQMLAAGGRNAVGQSLCDFTAYGTSLLVMFCIVGCLLAAAASVAGIHLELHNLLGGFLPVILLTAAFSFMLYSLCSELISGVLLQFSAVVSLCFVSGCMYPVSFFPESVQKLAAWLPAGVARDRLSVCFGGEPGESVLPMCLVYSLCFLAVGCFARVRAIRQIRR